MRKQTKLVAVLSAAALLAIGASMTSFAAGWAQEDGVWVYLDKDGDRVTDTWKKSGTGYYYLNEDGEMAVDTVIDDSDNNGNKYYVDASGARVANRWVSVDNEEDEPVGGNDDISTLWYYFGSNGKAYKAKDDKDYVSKTIDGKTYLFDEEGRMLSGWQILTDDKDKTIIYYLGGENEGWAATGWQYLEPDESMAPEDPEAEYDDEEWFYFSTSNGKASLDKRQYISGKYYAFDKWGVMQNKWLLATITDVATPSRYKEKEDGSQATGWVKAYAVTDTEEDGSESWYYLDSKGIPYNYGNTTGPQASKKDADGWTSGTDNVTGVAAKVIKNKTYLFDGNGKMLTGVFRLLDEVDCGNSKKLAPGVYYFSKDDNSAEGSMVTGKVSVSYDGDTYNYYFRKSTGQAYVWRIVDGTLYGANGERVDAKDDNNYKLYKLPADVYDKNADPAVDEPLVKKGMEVIVSATGKIKKSGSVKIDDIKYNIGKTAELDDYVAAPAPAKK